ATRSNFQNRPTATHAASSLLQRWARRLTRSRRTRVRSSISARGRSASFRWCRRARTGVHSRRSSSASRWVERGSRRVVVQAGDVLARHLEMPIIEALAPRSLYRRVYLHSHIRTRQWYRGGRTFVWVDGGDNNASRYTPAQKHLALV